MHMITTSSMNIRALRSISEAGAYSMIRREERKRLQELQDIASRTEVGPGRILAGEGGLLASYAESIRQYREDETLRAINVGAVQAGRDRGPMSF